MSEQDPTSRKLGTIGLIASIAYLGVFALLFGDKLVVIRDLDLPSAGDLLAGLFAPLAFLWLVLGFYQQGAELRLQIEEMRNSVREFEAQTKLQREALEHERKQVVAASARQRLLDLPRQLSVVAEPLNVPLKVPIGMRTVHGAVFTSDQVQHLAAVGRPHAAFALVRSSIQQWREKYPSWWTEMARTFPDVADAFSQRVVDFEKAAISAIELVVRADDDILNDELKELRVEETLGSLKSCVAEFPTE